MKYVNKNGYFYKINNSGKKIRISKTEYNKKYKNKNIFKREVLNLNVKIG